MVCFHYFDPPNFAILLLRGGLMNLSDFMYAAILGRASKRSKKSTSLGKLKKK